MTKLLYVAGCLIGLVVVLLGGVEAAPPPGQELVVLAWNDLGMHCYNDDFSAMAVLPPYNNLWAQVIRPGSPPQMVTTGIKVTYAFADNTTSVSKTNFWDYAEALFGVKLQPDAGLTGKGLQGVMDLKDDHFTAEGIPLTEYSDSAPTVRQPFQLATVTVLDEATGKELARTVAVAPVSSEMNCEGCHADGKEGSEDVHTGRVDLNILQVHDEHEGTQLASQTPVLCAKCHASNALGAPGEPDVPNLSHAMHAHHAPGHDDEVAHETSDLLTFVSFSAHEESEEEEGSPDTLEGCYNCHPGAQTQCLRDVMATEEDMTCIDCHGGMKQVASKSQPWLEEPSCDSTDCHPSIELNQPLYRMSTGHGGVYCAGCHDSPHAIAPSREPNDGLKFVALQGRASALRACDVCHTDAQKGRIHPRD